MSVENLPMVLTWEGEPVTEQTRPLAEQAMKDEAEALAKLAQVGSLLRSWRLQEIQRMVKR